MGHVPPWGLSTLVLLGEALGDIHMPYLAHAIGQRRRPNEERGMGATVALAVRKIASGLMLETSGELFMITRMRDSGSDTSRFSAHPGLDAIVASPPLALRVRRRRRRPRRKKEEEAPPLGLVGVCSFRALAGPASGRLVPERTANEGRCSSSSLSRSKTIVSHKALRERCHGNAWVTSSQF